MATQNAESLSQQRIQLGDRVVGSGILSAVGAIAAGINATALAVNEIANQFEKTAAYPVTAIGAVTCVYGLKRLISSRRKLKQFDENYPGLAKRGRNADFSPQGFSLPIEKAPDSGGVVIPLPEPVPEREAA